MHKSDHPNYSSQEKETKNSLTNAAAVLITQRVYRQHLPNRNILRHDNYKAIVNKSIFSKQILIPITLIILLSNKSPKIS